jgi:hypothetical protein
MSFLTDLISITISTRTRAPTRAGFGTALIAAYHTLYADRVRTYSSLGGLLTDGFKTSDPVYKIAAALLAQDPSVRSFKVGRRALPYTQVVDLTPTSPAASEVYTVKVGGLEASYTADATPTVAEVCSGLATAINALADVDAILATGGASAIAEQTISGASLNGVTGYRDMTVPRKITLVLSSHADWDATTATLTGLDVDGNSQSESLTIPNGGNSTVTSTKRYKRVVSLTIPAQSGTGGTFTVGVAAPVTADGSSNTKVACTSSAGELHSFEVTTSNAGVLNLSIKDQTTDPGIATDLGNILAADSDWYTLLLDSQSAAEVSTASTGAAAWVESNKKTLIPQTADAGCLSSSSITDVMYVLKAAGYARTMQAIYTPGLYTEWHAAAWAGECLPLDPGSETWAHKALSGVSVYNLTDTQRSALDGKNGNYYISAGGLALTYPGKTASGEWFDVTRFVDWLQARLRERLIGLLANNSKVPFTDAGIALVVAEIRAQLQQGVAVGGLAESPAFTISAPLASDVSSVDRAARTLPDVTFSARLAGAIHAIELTGNIAA